MFKNLAVYLLIALAVFAVYASAACVDDEDGHCAVFANLCDNTDFAAYTTKCPKTCGKC